MKKTHPLILAAALTPCRLCICHGHSVHPSRKLDPGTDRSNYPCPNHSPFYPVANSYNNGDTYYAFVPAARTVCC